MVQCILENGMLSIITLGGMDLTNLPAHTVLVRTRSGIKMGVSSIDDVLGYVSDENFRQILNKCKEDHIKLKDEIQTLLDKYHDDGKDPNPMAKSMSWMKTNVKLVMNESDNTIADLMTDGCNMGVKSLRKYLNQYQAADEKSKDITKKLINLEEKLTQDIRMYL